jgi:hypothetical protein
MALRLALVGYGLPSQACQAPFIQAVGPVIVARDNRHSLRAQTRERHHRPGMLLLVVVEALLI